MTNTLTPEVYEALGFKLAHNGFQLKTSTYLLALVEYPRGWFLSVIPDGHGPIKHTHLITSDAVLREVVTPYLPQQ